MCAIESRFIEETDAIEEAQQTVNLWAKWREINENENVNEKLANREEGKLLATGGWH